MRLMLTVHVGLHKTGTTSIQAALGTAKGDIRRRQVYLRWTDLFITDGTVNESGVPAIRDLSRRGWSTVVSSEGALGPMSLVYPDAADVARTLESALTGIPFQVVVYLRPQHEWVSSAYTQYVKEGGTDHPSDYVKTMLGLPHLRYCSLVDDLTDNLHEGRLIVRPYGPGCDAVTDFFAHANLGPVPAYLGHLRANSSVSAEEVASLRQANLAGQASDQVHTLVPADNAQRSQTSPLPEADQRQLFDLFQEDWDALATRMTGFPDHDAAEFQSIRQAYRGWTPMPFREVHPAAPGNSRSEASEAPSELAHSDREADRRATWQERRRRMEFQLRHGPRQTLLRMLARPKAASWQ